jgi:hypothetical protein
MPRIKVVTRKTPLGSYRTKVITPINLGFGEFYLKRPYLTKNPPEDIQELTKLNESALTQFPRDNYEEVELYYSKNGPK